MLINCVATGLGDVKKEQNCSVQVSKRSDGLHLNCVSLVKWVIQNTWRIDNLPSGVLVISVSDEQVLRSESVRLHINVGIRDIVNEAGLSDVGETCDD